MKYFESSKQNKNTDWRLCLSCIVVLQPPHFDTFIANEDIVNRISTNISTIIHSCHVLLRYIKKLSSDDPIREVAVRSIATPTGTPSTSRVERKDNISSLESKIGYSALDDDRNVGLRYGSIGLPTNPCRGIDPSTEPHGRQVNEIEIPINRHQTLEFHHWVLDFGVGLLQFFTPHLCWL
ncbi:hypothetical protein M422DRAFT_247787 [Sphaerobolus stellatus SS14]|nr:hypothetical protein M422DRAFT_247787 [Sphaerobolus stellatus SS14]